MKWQADWITPAADYPEGAALFFEKSFPAKAVTNALLTVSALGVYEAKLNGTVVSWILAPGWTEYTSRIQYQTYDVTKLIRAKNRLSIEVGTGWMRGKIARVQPTQKKAPAAVIAELCLTYADGTTETILSDESWTTSASPIVFSDIYDGETCDARFTDRRHAPVKLLRWSKSVLIPQEGEIIKTYERLTPRVFRTPAGETVLDFGQNMTGMIEFTVNARAGSHVTFDCGEELSADGNFYRDNYRAARSTLDYICAEGENHYRSKFSFFGFRYLRVLHWPKRTVDPSAVTGVVVHSELTRTGYLTSSDKLLNRLFENVVWGQKCNYLDVPTDCPQRNERMGWTGDAQVFARTATFNFDCEKFFTKWLHDLIATSGPDGSVPKMVPYYWQGGHPDHTKNILSAGAAWGDAATVCPWEVYLSYGNKKILADQYASMSGYVDYMTAQSADKYRFNGHPHYGDWLGIDAPEGSYVGASRKEVIAQAFYAHSTLLTVKAGRVLGKDVTAYEKLYKNIVKSFRTLWQDDFQTQTEHALALHFGLAKDPKKVADSLDAMVKKNGNKLTTGFVGTPYLLHALSENGHADTAWSLLLQKDFPSWLFSVSLGATTMWEHWDGKKADGSFWSADMNSFNHYAYGAVADWVYTVAAGIRRVEEAPGFARIEFCPMPDKRLGSLEARVMTRAGEVRSKWTHEAGFIRYEITTPSDAVIRLGDATYEVAPGSYMFVREEA